MSEHRAPRVARVELIQDLSGISSATDGFLRRHRVRAKSVMTDGHRTDTYVIDYVDRERARRDAVVALAYARPAPGRPAAEAEVLLRRQMRYPAQIVLGQPLMLEAVAGIVEGAEDVRHAARRELWEEAGFDVPVAHLKRLGQSFFPSPGILTERIHVVVAELAEPPSATGPRVPPPTDGHPMEAGAELVALSLGDALRLTEVEPHEEIFLADAKTEIALRRLQAHLTLEEVAR